MTSRREPKRERPGMTWELRSLCRPSRRAHLLTTRKRTVVWPAAIVRSPPGVPSLPSMDRPAGANGGLCIGRSCADAMGAWGPWATNKLRRVYAGALLATTINTHK